MTTLRPIKGASIPKPGGFRGSDAKRARLEALRLENTDTTLKTVRAQRAAAMKMPPSRRGTPGDELGASTDGLGSRTPNPTRGGGLAPLRAPTAGVDDRASTLPVDWRMLAACEVVLDREDERRRKDKKVTAVAAMHKELRVQLDRNAERRAAERKEKHDWIRSVREETTRVHETEAREKKARHEKRLADREMFREQAALQRAQRQEARALASRLRHTDL